MALILSLNDLSCASDLQPAHIDARMDEFVSVARELRRLRPDVALVSAERLPDILLAAEYPMSRWAADNRNVDRWRFLRRLQDRAPYRFADIAPNLENDDHEYRHGNDLALGLGLAHGIEGLAVSLAVDERWNTHFVDLTRVWIDQDDEVVTVRHASVPIHVEQHRDWLARSDIDDIATGMQLWEARAFLYPDLTFLPRVERDLRGLQTRFLPIVRTRLLEIQEAVREWNPADGTGPQWRSLVTPEHEGRRAYCYFEDLDGVTRLFDLHARFTPGAMRLHFRLMPIDRQARIAYVGRKLGI